MPEWAQIVGGMATLVVAVGILWTKVLRPGVRAAAAAEQILPLLRELAAQLSTSPNSFAILKEIIAQFRTDSGSSLRDAVDGLTAAATENKIAAEVLKVNVGAVKELAAQDRATIAHLLVLLDRLTVRVDEGSATATRMEEAAGLVADNLATRRAEEQTK